MARHSRASTSLDIETQVTDTKDIGVEEIDKKGIGTGVKNHGRRQTPPPTTWVRFRAPLVLVLILAGMIALHFIALSQSADNEEAWTSCGDLIHKIDYTKHIPALTGTQEMAAVQFVDELLGGQPGAMVQVMDSQLQGQRRLAVYIFGCEVQRHTPTLRLIFERGGLLQGSATVTQAHTLSIGQLDNHLDSDSYALLQPLQQNIFQEYRWTQGIFTQVRFPGLYPVMSRSEAEALQAQANNGQTLPWNNPVSTAQQMAQDIFGWPERDLKATLEDATGTTAHVHLARQQPREDVEVTLTRLLQPAQDSGLWFVTDAHSDGITLNTEQLQMTHNSPLQIQGTIKPTKTKSGLRFQLFDHTLSPLNIQGIQTPEGTPEGKSTEPGEDGKYGRSIPYTVSGSGQAGLLLIEWLPPAKSKERGQLILAGLLLN